jgi:O-antigen/teichoic acid export membrane protein
MIKTGLIKTAVVRYLSGADDIEKKQIIGSGWILGLILTTIVSILIFAILLIFPQPIKNSAYYLFFFYYPIFTFVSLPYSNTIGILEAGQKFLAIFFLRTLSTGLFLIVVTINYFIPKNDISIIVVAHIIVHVIVSVVTIFRGWDGFKEITRATRTKLSCLLNYGKYSVGTVLGSNLLKSSDTIIIGLSSLGPAAAALYSVPLKLIEIMDIPLRSFVLNAFPKMSQASLRGDNDLVKRFFYQYSGSISLIFIPGVIFCLIFAKYLILIIGGEQYVQSETAIALFQIFAFYSLLLPVDRFCGITLDSINKPKLNLVKVLIMASLNIIGDLVAVFNFNSIIGVAIVTVLFTIIGQFIGYRYLRNEIKIEYHQIFVQGYEFLLQGTKAFFKSNQQSRDK